MKRTSQFGRTMLETISILALIGVLGVTGIYMYKKGMDSVRADSVVKDVLIRAEQKNANDNLNDMGTKKNVFVPEYKKGTGDASEYRTKGSYGYSYEITYSATDAVVVKTNDTIITPGACNAIKSKLTTYDAKKSPRVVCAVQNPLQGNDIVKNCVKDATDIISNGCPDENIDSLYFVVAFGQSIERRAPLSRPEISPNKKDDDCPVGTSKDGTGDIAENGCRCLHPLAHWTGSHCVICDENEVWNSRLKKCEHGCPVGKVLYEGENGVSQCCSNICEAGGSVRVGTEYDSTIMLRGENCSCDCVPPYEWTNQNSCCIAMERTDGTFDCKKITFNASYNNLNSQHQRPFYKSEFSAAYKEDHQICLTVNGVDDDFRVLVGSQVDGPFWNGACAGLGAGNINNHKKTKKYFVPANTRFELQIVDVCPTNIGINYSISFCDD